LQFHAAIQLVGTSIGKQYAERAIEADKNAEGKYKLLAKLLFALGASADEKDKAKQYIAEAKPVVE